MSLLTPDFAFGQPAFALSADEVIARSQPVSADAARAGACFELGQYLLANSGPEAGPDGGLDAAAPWWREAHKLDPTNWTYRRQAWSLSTTVAGQPADLIQEPTDRFEGNWLDDLVASGGADSYYAPFSGV